jgi:hypothetical protein
MRREVRLRNLRLALGTAAAAVVIAVAVFLLAPGGSENPDVAVSISGVPDYIFLDQAFDLTITYENRGEVRSDPVALSVRLLESFEIQKSTQPPDRGEAALIWQLPGLLPGEQGFITLTLKGSAPDPGTRGDYEYEEGYVAFEDGFEVTVRALSAEGSLLDEALAKADTGTCIPCQYVVNLSWRIAGSTPGATWSLLRIGPGEIASGPVVYSSTEDYTDGGGGTKGLLECETDYEYVLRVAVGNRVVSTQPIVGRTGDCL